MALDEEFLTLTRTPVLGVCLGHRLVRRHFGATIEALPAPVDLACVPVRHPPHSSLFVGDSRVWTDERWGEAPVTG
ncbi:MAG: hypothetical protein ACC683_01700 [Acidimicrobiia bacterium]